MKRIIRSNALSLSYLVLPLALTITSCNGPVTTTVSNPMGTSPAASQSSGQSSQVGTSVSTASSSASSTTSPSVAAPTSATFQITLTNGSEMPISPGAIYVTNNQLSVTEIGTSASPGFVTLCTTGNPSGIVGELSSNPAVVWSNTATNGQMYPGQSQTFQVTVSNVMTDSLHFTAMYGLTKDTCAAIDINSLQLNALAQGASQGLNQMRGVDRAISTGMFSDPAVVSTSNCTSGTVADCLRSLTVSTPTGTIHYYSPFLPTVSEYLENHFPASKQASGAPITQNLLLTGGEVSYLIKVLN